MKPQVRIIGGKWRGRKLSVVDAEGLRPTPDRVRETLFNWLSLDCPRASVLDCFAGSGVLGFEALSKLEIPDHKKNVLFSFTKNLINREH